MSAPTPPFAPLPGAQPTTAGDAGAPVPPSGAEATGPTPFRRRLVAALRDLARIERRVAYEADAMDRSPADGGRRIGPARDSEAEERLATPRERGR